MSHAPSPSTVAPAAACPARSRLSERTAERRNRGAKPPPLRWPSSSSRGNHNQLRPVCLFHMHCSPTEAQRGMPLKILSATAMVFLQVRENQLKFWL